MDSYESKNTFPIVIVVAAMAGLLISVGISLYQNSLLKKEVIDLQNKNEAISAEINTTITPIPTLETDITTATPSADSLIGNTDEEIAIEKMMSDYLDAYTSKNWIRVRELLPTSAVEYFDEFLAEGYEITEYEITSIRKNDNPKGSYIVMAKLFNDMGEIQKRRGEEELSFLVIKEGEEWKTLTWYLFE